MGWQRHVQSRFPRVEHLLSEVQQAPSLPMQDALLPIMRALIAQDLLGHLHEDVKVSVASCLSEITRITAPDAPYNDELMKEIFKLTVMALEKLNCASGRSYTKAISILDTIAQVRSCLVMLDLECDELIVEMFQLFFNTIRSSHPHSVLSGMETVMTLIIQESEEISLELLIPLLTSVKKENQNVLPLSWKLGENVLKNCAAKLKTYLPEAVQFMGISLIDFAEIVSLICRDASEKVSKELALDDVCPGRAGSSVDGSSRSVINAGATQMRGNDALGDENSLKTLECSQSKQLKCTDARSEAHLDSLECTKAVNQETEPESVPKKRNRKPNSLIKPEEGYDPAWIIGGRKALQLPHRRKTHEREPGGSSKDSQSREAALPLEPEKDTKPQVFPAKTSHSKSTTASQSQDPSYPDERHPKRGRPKKKGNVMNQDGSLDLLSVPKGELPSPQEITSQSADITLKELSEVKKYLKAKSEKDLRKNALVAKASVETTPAAGNVAVTKEYMVPSDSEEKQEPSAPQMDGKKKNRGNITSGDHIVKDDKMVSFSATGSLKKDESQLVEASKTKRKRKRTPQKEEVSEMARDIKEYGEELVGCKIKVWWPLDQKFYEGVVNSFDPIKKQHMVVYADGDEEILDLRKEHWKLIGKNSLPEKGQ